MHITLYQVWSRLLPFEEHAPVLHGTRSRWTVTGTEDGAIQLKDKVLEQFYREAEAVRRQNELAYHKDLPIIRIPNAHVYLKEVVVDLDESNLASA